ncbi:CAP domain-containing protein [Nocardioides soli]|uniref:Uncharacterized protein YkwD n=1 Tax=Nocardioides soli TaxID=1036020 RepID=A0A7W4VSR7_9ACTN|nr:CAP domain-containing protein [Nocardioides soli]MBB3041137.1 uncharacterized protein YkwD [Nocardioides soli]
MFLGIRQSVLAALAAVVVATTLWLTPAQAKAPEARYADTAFSATNQQRTDRSLSRLRKQACLTGFAERWARSMARKGELVHQSLKPMLRRCDLTMVGENIAVGYPSGKAVVNRGWMHSSGHRANILRRQFRLMGIGAYRDDDGRWWVSQVFGRG